MKIEKTPLYRNVKIIALFLQVIFVILLLTLATWLFSNLQSALAKQNLNIELSFMNEVAGFSLSEGPEFSSEESYWSAFYVGIVNTLRVSVLGVVFCTLLGVIVGVARLSQNILVRMLSTIFVETFRNIPLLVQLFVWYYVIYLSLPNIRQAIQIPGSIFLSNRGFYFPWVQISNSHFYLESFFIVLLLISASAYYLLRHAQAKTKLYRFQKVLPFLTLLIFVAIFVFNDSITLVVPELRGFNFRGGIRFSPELMALFSGLTFYTAAFIAEIVRGGIQAIPKGQKEAALSLGLTSYQSFISVIFPQALRVILPPLANQHLNLIKNSSLAIAIGFADLFQVSQTITNQSGNAIPLILLVMFSYLIMSLLTSALINWFNLKTKIVRN